jgi:hypothetical protein
MVSERHIAWYSEYNNKFFYGIAIVTPNIIQNCMFQVTHEKHTTEHLYEYNTR